MSSNYHTDIPNVSPANASVFNSPLGELDQAISNFRDGFNPFVQINLGVAGALTIATDAITVTKTYHVIDTEGGAASDNLSTINGATEGDLLWLKIANNARVVTLKHNVGNIFLSDAADRLLDNTNKMVILRYNGSKWVDDLKPSSAAETVIVANTELSGNLATIDLTSIPATFKHLKLILQLRTDRAGATVDDVYVRFNADSNAANYYSYSAYISGTTPTTTALERLGATATGIQVANGATGATASTDHISLVEILIANYRATNHPRFTKWDLYLQRSTGTGQLVAEIGGGMWSNAVDIINQITLVPVNGSNFVAKSTYELIGVS